ncbi:hypothetical protein MRB53_023726 [Persea americana]|uniref:Uncharacterized protein n=1 Tax=Persea americana TaxID=3435 RepID=A0ACC2LBF1_PERAE|nr:hypothetical protein MRB53_023726 [Persea americana]
MFDTVCLGPYLALEFGCLGKANGDDMELNTTVLFLSSSLVPIENNNQIGILCAFLEHQQVVSSLAIVKSSRTLKSRTKDLGLEVIVIGDDLTKKKTIWVSVAWKPATARVLVALMSLDSSLGGHLHRRKSSQALRFSSVTEQNA